MTTPSGFSVRQALCVAAAAWLTGCGGGGSSMNGGTQPPPAGSPPASTATPPAVMQAQSEGAAVDPAIVAADNGFGLALFQNLNSGATANVAISPISVAMALQIVYNGAAGATQPAMAQTLQLGTLSTAALNDDNAALQASLLNPDPAVEVTLANSLWLHLSDTPVLASFTQTDQTYYGAMVGDLAGAPGNVNEWVSTATQGLITEILPQQSYASVLAVIANVIYFKGQWSTAFDPSRTSAAPFTLLDGTQTTAQLMHQNGSFAYLRGANFQALSLPYGTGRMSMLLVLPDTQVDFNGFVAALSASTLSGWIGQLQSGIGEIDLPRFTSTYGAALSGPLTALGMAAAFCSDPTVNFSLLAPSACISDVEHKTVVDVDESGTVAAGATTITVSPVAMVLPSYTMTLDHPFFYAIRDNQTGELLFIGTVVNPAS